MNTSEIMAIDKTFCHDCETGKADAWASYFLEDGIMVTSGTRDNIIGKDAIRQEMEKVFSLQDIKFSWAPDMAEVSDDETLAVTKGTSHMSYTKDGKTVIHEGNYTTIWKKVNDTWKIVWDIGN